MCTIAHINHSRMVDLGICAHRTPNSSCFQRGGPAPQEQKGGNTTISPSLPDKHPDIIYPWFVLKWFVRANAHILHLCIWTTTSSPLCGCDRVLNISGAMTFNLPPNSTGSLCNPLVFCMLHVNFCSFCIQLQKINNVPQNFRKQTTGWTCHPTSEPPPGAGNFHTRKGGCGCRVLGLFSPIFWGGWV